MPSTPRTHEKRAPARPHSGTAAPLEILSPARQKRAQRAESDEDVFGLFFQEGYETARGDNENDREEREAQARRGAYRAGKADANRQTKARPAPAENRPAKSQPDQSTTLRAPNVRVPGGDIFSGGVDRQTSARIIVVCVAVAGIGAVARDALATKSAPTKISVDVGGGKMLTVPTHLHSLAGVVIVGTIALVVNEFQPQVGMALAILLLIDVGIQVFSGRTGLANRIAGGLITTGKAQSLSEQIANLAPGSIATLPNGAQIVKPKSGAPPYQLNPVPGKPGQYSQNPLPGQYNPGYATA